MATLPPTLMSKLVKELLVATNSQVKRPHKQSIWWLMKNKRSDSLIRSKSSTRSLAMLGSMRTYIVLTMALGHLDITPNLPKLTSSEIRPCSHTKVAGSLTRLGLQIPRHSLLVSQKSLSATLFGLHLPIKSIWTQLRRLSSSRLINSASANSITTMIYLHLVTLKHSQMRPL